MKDKKLDLQTDGIKIVVLDHGLGGIETIIEQFDHKHNKWVDVSTPIENFLSISAERNFKNSTFELNIKQYK